MFPPPLRPNKQQQAKEEFNKIQLELADLSTKFSNNVLDATKAFSLTLTGKADVEGLPASALGLAAQSAKVCVCMCVRVRRVSFVLASTTPEPVGLYSESTSISAGLHKGRTCFPSESLGVRRMEQGRS